jgi:uncharacterized protein (DUF697 family)
MNQDPFDAEKVTDSTADLVSSEKKADAFDKLVDWFIDLDPLAVKHYVERLRNRHPHWTDRELANHVIGVKSFQNGLLGAATGIPGVLALPVTVPTDLVLSWKIQIHLALCIAQIYGHDLEAKDHDDIKTDMYMIMAGNVACDHLAVLGLEIDGVTQQALKRYFNRELMSELWKRIGREIVASTARKSTVKLTRMIPLVGAPIGFAFDYAAAKSVGAFARHYYGKDFSASPQAA